MAKKQNGILGNIIKYALIVPAIASLTRNLMVMMQAEAILLRKRVIYFVVLALFALVLVLSMWGLANSLLVTWLTQINFTLITAISLAMLVNFTLLMIVFLIIALMKIDLSFPETRKTVTKYIKNT